MARSNYFREVRSRAPMRMRLGAGAGAGAEGGRSQFDPFGIGPALQKSIAAYQLQKQQAAQDQIINQMYNTRNAPRAQLVTNAAGQGLRINPKTAQAVNTPFGPGLSGTPTAFRPAPGVRTAGTAPFTGGAAELQARAAANKLMDEADPVGAAVNRARAAVAASQVTGLPPSGSGSRGGRTRVAAGVGSGGRAATGTTGTAGTAKAPKATKGDPIPEYQANSATSPEGYNRDMMKKDFDHIYGDGAFDKMYPSLNNIQPGTGPDGKGAPSGGIDAKSGKALPFTGLSQDKSGNMTWWEGGIPKYNVGVNDIAGKWQDRFNTVRRNAGLEPLNMVPLQGGAQAGWTGKRNANGVAIDDQGNPIRGAGAKVGTPQNPAIPKDTFGVASVPNGASYVDPSDGQLKVMKDPVAKQQALESQQRESQLAQLHGFETPGSEPSYDEYEDPESQRRIAEIEAARNYDVAETPEDQAKIDQIAAAQAKAGPQPSDYYAGSPATSPAAAAAASPSPSDLYAGSPAVSYLSTSPATTSASAPIFDTSSAQSVGTGAPPEAPPPNLSPYVTGQEAAQAAASPQPTPDNPAPLQPSVPPVASYLYMGGY